METQPVFAIYSRKSKYTGTGESIENQIEMCREYIRIHYGESQAQSAVIYEDEGFSGKNLDRPQFRAMMAHAKNDGYRAIVVYRLDRISRNIGDFANLIHDLSRAGIDFISVKEQFDTGSPMGRAMMYISSVFSQLERETIAERIRDNLHELAKTGRWLGGNTPTGYRSRDVTAVTIDGKQKKAYMLEEIPEEMHTVDLIYDQFYQLRSLTKLDAFLIKNGHRTKRGNDFSRFATKAILTNPVYMIADEDAYRYLTEHKVQLFAGIDEFDGIHGIMAYNRTQQEKGKSHKINPMDEWIVSVGRHEGRIHGRIWAEIQEILDQNKSKNYRRPRSHTALLSGVLRCGSCGAYMRPKLGRSVSDSGERSYIYLCTVKERSQKSRCAVANADGSHLDEALMGQIKRLGEDGREFLKEIEKGRKRICKDEPWDSEADAVLQRELKANEGKIARLVQALSMAPQGSETYILEQIQGLGKKSEQLKLQAAQRKQSENRLDQSVVNPALPVSVLCSFGSMAETLSFARKRDVIRILIKDVIWDGEEAHVIL